MSKTILESARIIMRPVEMSDLETIHKLHCIPETDEYNTLGIPTDINETKSHLQDWLKELNKIEISKYTFVIEDKMNQKFIGLFGFNLSAKKYKKGEVWYIIHPDSWKKAYATESLNLILDFGFETLKLHRIEAGCAVGNIGSIKVLEKVGMLREGRGRKILPLKTGWSDNFEYAILESDKRKK